MNHMLVINHVWIPALMFGVYINTSFYLNHITSDLNVNFEYFCPNWFHFILQKCRLVRTFNTLRVDQQGHFERYEITFSFSATITFCLELSTNALATLSIFFPYFFLPHFLWKTTAWEHCCICTLHVALNVKNLSYDMILSRHRLSYDIV